MRTVAKKGRKGKKQRVLKEVEILSPEQYEQMALDARVETIQALIPLGLWHIGEELKKEVERLAGQRHERGPGGKALVRYGHNPGSVPLGGQRIGIRVPRIRNQHTNQEVPLESYGAFHQQSGQANETLLRRVLYGISCRNYEAAAEAIPGAIGLSASTVSRQFIEASSKQLKEFQERDLSELDLTALWLDGKTFAEDTLVIALGLTLEGRKVPLGFVQAGTENAKVLTDFLNELRDRGLKSEAGLLVILDGGKGLRAAVKKVFHQEAAVQRCQWHKRENVLRYLPKSEQAAMRRRLQRAYQRPTYREAKGALEGILRELEARNLDAAGSLREGLEETLTLHRLGLFAQLGTSLKTTNCIESVMSQVEVRCGKVSCWKNSPQKHRWLAATLLDIEPRLRRIRGYRYLPLLREVLQEELGMTKRKSVA
jgi:transposase-like protein